MTAKCGTSLVEKSSMTTFRVWLESLATSALVRVEGVENAYWLLRRLSQSFVFKSSKPIREERETTCFEIPYSSEMSRGRLERLLGSIPEVLLLAERV